jgi:membrane dipeptidase
VSAQALHRDSVVVDGLQIARYGPEVFAEMASAGITSATCTCSVWEGFRDTMRNIAAFQRWFIEHDDLLRPVRTVDDIHAAKAEGRVGVVLGFQNLSPIEDRLEFLALFKALGVGVMQLTYNTQNLVGSGCYETHDGGLTDYGRDAVAEMNRVGILVDLSHVGARTAADAVEASERPVVYTHVCPSGMKEHPRNRTDAEMRAVAEKGGMVGVTLFPAFLAAGNDATIDDYVDTIEYVLNVVGEDHVGVGTDFIDGHGRDYLTWLNHDKGDGRPIGDPDVIERLINVRLPRGIQRIGELPNLTDALVRRGWSDDRVRKLLGGNWLRVLADAWPTRVPQAVGDV